MIILKLGGSLITDKSKEFFSRKDVIERIAGEVKEGIKGKAIIVHGGGSFGHPVAMEYRLSEGYKDEGQLIGLALTRKAMEDLNRQVVNALISHDIPAVSIQPSANIICKDGRIEDIRLEVIERFIALGIIPVLYGDVVLDREKGFCILSGDQILSYLARAFKPDKVILATDVDGIFEKNPKKFKNSKFVTEINRDNFKEILESFGSPGSDVTEGIKGKIIELGELGNAGIESIIINGMETERLKKVLLGLEVKGTRVRMM